MPPGSWLRLLLERGDLDGLRGRADIGDPDAARELVRLLRERGDLNGAEQILRARAGAGDRYAARNLAILLYKRGDLDGAEQILRARANAGDPEAARELAGLLPRAATWTERSRSCGPGPTPATKTPPGSWPGC